jgi:hypothetical protein
MATARPPAPKLLLDRTIVLAVAAGMPARECHALRILLYVMNRSTMLAAAGFL